MAARKTTKPKSETSAPRTRKKAESAPEVQESAGLSRAAWGAIWAGLGVLTLLALLPIDGALLCWLHRFIGGFIGRGGLLLPFALFALSALLFLRPKGPVRLRGACIGLLPVLFGGIVHAITCANEYDFSMKTIRNLLETGMESHSGGLLSGMLYIVLEWALSSAGALIVLLLLTFAAIMVACRITPMMLIDMFRPPEYEYEDEEERARYEEPVQLPNVHEVAREINAAHAQKREERRARRQASDFDIPIDSNPPGEDKPGGAIPPVYPPHEEGKPLAPDEYLRGLKKPREEKREEQPDSIMELVANRADEPEDEPEAEAAPAEPAKPAAKPKKAESISEDEQAAMNDAMDESQKAPAPVYAYPPIDLLTQGKHASMAGAESELRESSACLLDTLESFNIDAQIIGIVRGPSVTRFELTIPRGIKISRVSALADDIALALGAANVRIAPIPDKSAVGIEVPNKTVNTVFIRECIGSNAFANAKSRLSFAVGKDITGRPVIGDIAKMPHMLIAGTTGSGKSVCMNSIIVSILYRAKPDEVKLVLIDPKKVEFSKYSGIPHLLVPVVTDPRKATGALGWAVSEMLKRYQTFSDTGVRDIEGYNKYVKKHEDMQPMPKIVICIDELSDLMMAAPKEIEDSICRLAQMARAAGMHLVIATQRPSVDVITGLIKANISSRIALTVSSQIDSRTILDASGAEKLLGYGDMLYAPIGSSKPIRVQGCYISDEEVESLCDFVKSQGESQYNADIQKEMEAKEVQPDSKKSPFKDDEGDEQLDQLFNDAVEIVLETGTASTSFLQRKLSVGYARGAKIMDQLEEKGIIGPQDGAKKREVRINKQQWLEMQNQGPAPKMNAETAEQMRFEEAESDEDQTDAE